MAERSNDRQSGAQLIRNKKGGSWDEFVTARFVKVCNHRFGLLTTFSFNSGGANGL